MATLATAVSVAVVVALLAAAVAAAGRPLSVPDVGGRSGSGVLWQGFDCKWLRTIAGFSTPHRFGSFANYVSSASTSSSSSFAANSAAALTGVVNMTWTPGVDGDYAHPRALLGGFAGGGASVVVSTAFVRHAQDNASRDGTPGNPVGIVTLQERVSIALPASLSPRPSATASAAAAPVFGAVLQGLRIDMKCHPDQQPAGDVCNSNGVWPFLLRAAVGNCTLTPTTVECGVEFEMRRAWTPTHGGGKSFNYVMDYDIHVPVALVVGARGELAVTASKPVGGKYGIHSGPLQGQTKVAGAAPGYSSGALVGLAAFEMRLEKTDTFSILGRYIEQLSFLANITAYDAATGVAAVNWQAGMLAPETVLPSQSVASVQPVLFQFGPSAASAVVANQPVTGTVCFDGKGLDRFNCADRHLKADTNDAVDFSLKL